MNEPRLQIMLLDYPVTIWQSTNQWFEEVRRELALAGLSGDPAAGRLGRQVVTLVTRHAAALGGDGESGATVLWAARERGLDRVDVGYEVSRDVTVTGPLVSQLVDDLDQRCREGLLLTLPPREEEKRLMHWIAQELLSQCAGESPRAWPGPWRVAP